MWKLFQNNDFLNNFHFNDPIVTSQPDIIWTFIVIVFTKNERSCIQITLGNRFLSIYRDRRGVLKI